jgi:hypothetical protein
VSSCRCVRAYIRTLLWEALSGLMGKHRDEVPFIVSGCARFAFIQTVRGIFAGKARSAAAIT